MTTTGLLCLAMRRKRRDVAGRELWRLLEISSSLGSSLLSSYSLLADSLLSAFVFGVTREVELLDEDGDGEEGVAGVEVAGAMAIIQGLLLPIAAPAPMIALALDLEADPLRKAGDRVSGREQWVALQRDMRWDGVPRTTTVPPLNREDRSLVDRITMMPERAVRGRLRRLHFQPRQPALDLDRQDAGSRSGFAKYIPLHKKQAMGKNMLC